ncbi:MAG: ATPase, T2SS/T4P/T4SS family [Candidatus Asgardarchaeia archaeon]
MTETNVVLDSYYIFPYKVTIIKSGDKKYYFIEKKKELIGNEKINIVLRKIIHRLYKAFFEDKSYFNNIKQISYSSIINYLNVLYNKLFLDPKNIRRYNNSRYKILKEFILEAKFYIIMKLLKLSFIYPFLADNNILEIYIQEESRSIYLDHAVWGRCTFFKKIKDKHILRIKNLIEVESGNILTEDNPSLKVTILTSLFSARFVIDGYPLTINGMHIDIRKFKKDPMTIFDLIKAKTLSVEVAAFLILCVFLRINILVIGKTGTGKTTLLNALDMITPTDWRKIYIEDLPESLDLSNINQKQIKYKLMTEGLSRYTEAINILHKNPDFVFLGEILSEEDSKTLFHVLLSGLHGLETFHADSAKDAINRFIIYHNIPTEIIDKIGIIVHMIKYYSNEGRTVFKVKDVSEVIYNSEEKSLSIRPLFVYDFTERVYVRAFTNLDEINVINKLNIGLRKLEWNNKNNINDIFKNIVVLLQKNKDIIDINNMTYFLKKLFTFL